MFFTRNGFRRLSAACLPICGSHGLGSGCRVREVVPGPRSRFLVGDSSESSQPSASSTFKDESLRALVPPTRPRVFFWGFPRPRPKGAAPPLETPSNRRIFVEMFHVGCL